MTDARYDRKIRVAGHDAGKGYRDILYSEANGGLGKAGE